MSDPQRWIWTPTGMAPYRPHPLMPDVGGVFVEAEEAAKLEQERDTFNREHENDVLIPYDQYDQLVADRDRWRTWAGQALEALRSVRSVLEARIARL